MSTADAQAWALVEAAAKAVTDEITGHYKSAEFAAELADRLAAAPEHVQEVVREQAVQRLVEGFHRRRTPQFKAQGGLYDPGYVLSLGRGERVWMAEAGRDDLVAWAGLGTANVEVVRVAADRRQEYVAARRRVMEQYPGRPLGWIEREFFGFTPGEPPEYAEPDDPEG